MLHNYAKIAGLGAFLPPQVVHNRDLEKSLDTNHDWIVSHTGIHSRHILADDQSVTDMAQKAAILALDRAGILPSELGLIIVTTSTPDYCNFPSCACILQERLKAPNAAAFDLTAACSGFIYGVEMGQCWLRFAGKPVLVVASEAGSRLVDWTDRNTCVLLGDGAAAVVLVPSDTPSFLKNYLGADGCGRELLYRQGGNMRRQPDSPVRPSYMQMQGRTLYQFAVKALESVANELMRDSGCSLDDLDYIVPHQANLRILEGVAKRLRIPVERFCTNISTVANTASASIPLVLNDLYESRRLKEGDLIMMITFGGGLTYAGSLMRWRDF